MAWTNYWMTKMPKPTHEQIKKVAEALSDALFNDWEELCNFVQSSLEYQYDDEEGMRNFLEDWKDYVEKE